MKHREGENCKTSSQKGLCKDVQIGDILGESGIATRHSGPLRRWREWTLQLCCCTLTTLQIAPEACPVLRPAFLCPDTHHIPNSCLPTAHPCCMHVASLMEGALSFCLCICIFVAFSVSSFISLIWLTLTAVSHVVPISQYHCVALPPSLTATALFTVSRPKVGSEIVASLTSPQQAMPYKPSASNLAVFAAPLLPRHQLQPEVPQSPTGRR